MVQQQVQATPNLAKVGVEGSNPFARSNKVRHLDYDPAHGVTAVATT